MPDLQTPESLMVKHTKNNADEHLPSDKNQEYIKPSNRRNQSFLKNFQQQTLPGWYFTPTIKSSLICTCFCWVVLIILGTINLAITSNLAEVINELLISYCLLVYF